ncbi:MAG: phage major capsid protein [bacterium]
MKKINELKQERKALIEEMQSLVDVPENEKRSQTDEEKQTWEANEQKVNDIDKQIEKLEKQERLNLSIVSTTKDDAETAKKRYNFSKAIKEARSGHLTGFEKEMHQEAENELRKVSGVRGNLYLPSVLISKREETAYTNADGVTGGHIPTDVGGIDINVPKPLYNEIGATVYNDLSSSKFELPFAKGYTAGKLSEGSKAAKGRPSRTKGTLSATRYQGYDFFSNEYLAETTVFPELMGDMIASIDRAVSKELLEEAVSANVMSGHGTTATGTAITYLEVLELLEKLEIEDFTNEGLIMSKELFYHLAGTERSANTAKYIIEIQEKNKGRLDGIKSIGTGYLPEHSSKFDIVYGDWKRAYVGYWGGIQLLVDPYTMADEGEVKVTYSRMADVAVNPYTFISKRDVIKE